MSLIQTLRTPRICGLAVFDLLLSIILTEVIFRYFGSCNWVGAALAIPIGVVVHAILKIDTTLNYKLGIRQAVS